MFIMTIRALKKAKNFANDTADQFIFIIGKGHYLVGLIVEVQMAPNTAGEYIGVAVRDRNVGALGTAMNPGTIRWRRDWYNLATNGANLYRNVMVINLLNYKIEGNKTRIYVDIHQLTGGANTISAILLYSESPVRTLITEV